MAKGGRTNSARGQLDFHSFSTFMAPQNTKVNSKNHANNDFFGQNYEGLEMVN